MNNSTDRHMQALDAIAAKTGLVPMTYSDATRLFLGNGRRSFSFLAAPYLVPKTVVIGDANGALAVTPEHIYAQESPLTGDLCEVCKANDYELYYAGAQMCTPCRDEAEAANAAIREARRS